MTSLSDLETLLSLLKGRPTTVDSVENGPYDDWAVFPAVEHAFDPTVASTSQRWIWWSAAAAEAFVDGKLERPALFRWHGYRPGLQVAAVRAGLCIRIVSQERYDQGGVFVMSPESAGTESDLSRLLQVFERMQADKIVALPLAGQAQSHGWEDVAEQQTSGNQSAIFWHGQSHDAFDDLGMLKRSMCLYWRGGRQKLAKHLRSGGFEVLVPDSESRAFEISSAAAPPAIADLSTAESFETQLLKRDRSTTAGDGPCVVSHTADLGAREGHHRPGASIARVWWTPDGDVLAATTLTKQDWDEPLALLDVETFERRMVFSHVSGAATCVGVRWMEDGRWLAAWHDQAEGASGLAYKIVENGTHVAVVHDAENGRIRTLAAGAESVAIARRNSISIHAIGPVGASLERAKTSGGMVARRRKSKPVGQGAQPWGEIAKIDVQPETYTWVALSSDGTTLVRTGPGKNSGLTALVAFDVASNTERWTWRPGSFSCKGHAQICDVGFSSADRYVVVSLRSLAERGLDREQDPSNRAVVLFDPDTGEIARPGLAAALAESRCVWVSPAGVAWVGHEDGTVSLHDEDDAEIGRTKVFEHGSVSAIDGQGVRVCVGSTRGELAILSA